MAEYIEREAAKDKFSDLLPIGRSIRDTLDEVPAADVVEVRHGEWKTAKAIVGVNPATLDFEIGDADRCSLCGVDFEAVRPKYKYCPNCGAKMDGKGEE